MSVSNDSSDASRQMSPHGLDLDIELRQQREETRRQRMELIQQRRQEERRHQAEERKRRQFQNDMYQNNNGDDDGYGNEPSSAKILQKSSNSNLDMDVFSSSNNSHDLLLSTPSSRVKFKSGPSKFNSSPRQSRSSASSSCLRTTSSLRRYNKDAKANTFQNKKMQKSTYAGSSDSSDDDMNRYPKNRWSNAQRRGMSYGDRSSSTDEGNNGSKHASKPQFTTHIAKATTKSRSESDDSDSSEDPVEAMMRIMRAKKEKAEAAASKAAEVASATSGNSRASLLHSSSEKSRRGKFSKHSPRNRSAYDSEDDDTDEDMASAALQLRRESHAKRYKHNPIAMERREQEEREEQRRKNISASSTTSKKTKLEGMEVMVGDEGEVKSVSDMADDIREARLGGDWRGEGTKGGDAGNKTSWQKPFHETYKQRGSNDANKNRGGNDDSPNFKRQYNINRAAKMRDDYPDDDGLWDSSDSNDERKSTMKTKKMSSKKVDRDHRGSKNIDKKKEQITQKRSPQGTNGCESNVASNETISSDDSDVGQRKKQALEKRRCLKSSSSDSDEDKNTTHKKPSSRFGIDDANQSDDASNGESERLQSRLKPDFADPKLGIPGPLVPFALSKTWKVGDSLIGCNDVNEMNGDDDNETRPADPTNDGDIDHVPASINRYLKGYQRVGIQFIYSSVSHGRGCVLGGK